MVGQGEVGSVVATWYTRRAKVAWPCLDYGCENSSLGVGEPVFTLIVSANGPRKQQETKSWVGPGNWAIAAHLWHFRSQSAASSCVRCLCSLYLELVTVLDCS